MWYASPLTALYIEPAIKDPQPVWQRESDIDWHAEPRLSYEEVLAMGYDSYADHCLNQHGGTQAYINWWGGYGGALYNRNRRTLSGEMQALNIKLHRINDWVDELPDMEDWHHIWEVLWWRLNAGFLLDRMGKGAENPETSRAEALAAWEEYRAKLWDGIDSDYPNDNSEYRRDFLRRWPALIEQMNAAMDLGRAWGGPSGERQVAAFFAHSAKGGYSQSSPWKE